MKDLTENIKKESVEFIIFDISYKVFYFDTWKEQMLFK